MATSRCTGLNLGPAGQAEGRVWVHALPITEPRGDLLSPDTQPRRLPSHGVPCPPWENPEAWKTGLHTGSGSGGRTFFEGLPMGGGVQVLMTLGCPGAPAC